MQKKLLTELIHELEQEMLRLGYSEYPMRLYRRRWRTLLQFAEERGDLYYSKQLGIDFVEKYFNISEENANRKFSEYELKELRVIRRISEFQLHHTIFRRSKQRDILTNPSFMVLREKFQFFCENKKYSKATTYQLIQKFVRFMDYLSSQNITDCKKINLSLIHAYIKTFAGYAPLTMNRNICYIRTFMRFLLEIEEVQTDFTAKIPTVQIRNQTLIPSVWTKDELQKLITAIDRKSPIGKRDYAVILLACCLGMRVSDIRNLKKEDFHWEEKKLIFIQSKTKVSLSLPITPEVGWAVIDYLKYGRPNIDNPYLFVSHLAPFGPLKEGGNFFEVIRKYMRLAHLPTLKKKRGMHSLRHTMASMLLEKDTPLSTISDLLGHVETNSTAVYLKVGMQKLKDCALNFKEGSSHE